MRHLATAELEAGLAEILRAPKDAGRLELIVRRPAIGVREEIPVAQLDRAEGLVGDNWRLRGSRSMPGGAANPDAQLTLMSVRVIALLAVERARWPLAGDQLFVDLDLGVENLPAGTRLALGEAVIEVTAMPHTGCARFVERFGRDAMQFVNSPQGRALRLRGLNARVLEPGAIHTGDAVRKIAVTASG